MLNSCKRKQTMANEQICRKIFYVFDKSLRDATDNIKKIKLRSAAVHSLIKSYKLLDKCAVCSINLASETDLLTFHSAAYVNYLKKAQNSSDLEKLANAEEVAEYNLEYDCPLFQNVYDFACIIAGGTLTAANLLCPKDLPKEHIIISDNVVPKSYLRFKQKGGMENNLSNIYDLPSNLSMDESCFESNSSPMVPRRTPQISASETVTKSKPESQIVAINWFGGWHHAQRDAAEGFCYVNDIVIGIQSLLKFYNRIVYVDLDVHHGDGVENAFACSPHVLTVSFHKYEPGYYPGTGSIEDTGIGQGVNFAVNVPLKDGITDGAYMQLFSKIMAKIQTVYEPDCLVIQCGADGLSGDPLGGFNLTLKGLGYCVQSLLDWRLPSVLLGGGGYNVPNAARYYAYLTSLALNEKISTNIPDNDFFNLYGPDFELDITPTLRKNENTEEYLNGIQEKVLRNLDGIKI